MLNTNRSIRVATIIKDLVVDMITDTKVGERDLYLSVFNNCREQGYVITSYYGIKNLKVWLYANRHTDKPTITWEYDNYDSNDMFGEIGYNENTIQFDSFEEAATKVFNLLDSYN